MMYRFNSRIRFALCLFPALMTGRVVWAETTDRAYVAPGSETAAAASRQLLERLQRELGIPGMSVAVWRNDAIVWSEGLGVAQFEHKAPVTRSTRFRLGSCSKILTASLTAKLARQAKIDLDKDIREYVPTFPDKGAKITTRQLLGHLGGIRHYEKKDFDVTAPGGMVDLRPYPSSKEVLATFASDALVGRPGEKYFYSTYGYSLVMLVLESATGKPFLELIHDELTGPLKLTSVVGDDLLSVIPDRTGFYEKNAKGEIGLAAPVSQAYKWSGGGLLSSADDLAQFGAAHFTSGFFSGEVLSDLFASQKSADGKETGTGLGWRVSADAKGRSIVHHAGNMGGCRAILVVWRDQRVAIALLSNLTGAPNDIMATAQQIAEKFLPEK